MELIKAQGQLENAVSRKISKFESILNKISGKILHEYDTNTRIKRTKDNQVGICISEGQMKDKPAFKGPSNGLYYILLGKTVRCHIKNTFLKKILTFLE